MITLLGQIRDLYEDNPSSLVSFYHQVQSFLHGRLPKMTVLITILGQPNHTKGLVETNEDVKKQTDIGHSIKQELFPVW